MKCFNISELENLAKELSQLVGARLQRMVAGNRELGLGFYHSGQEIWLWADLNPVCPLLLILDKPPSKAKTTKPVLLFLRSHALGKRLVRVARSQEQGRVLILELGSGQSPENNCEIEIRLFPHGQNLIARTQASQISWHKIKQGPMKGGTESEGEVRSLLEIRQQWEEQKSSRSAGSSKTDWRKIRDRTLGKKQKALGKMSLDLQEKQNNSWAETGEWLKQNGTLKVPAKWQEKIDRKKSLAWNIERCFKKSKDIRRKLQGSRERIEILKTEIKKLQNQTGPPKVSDRPERPLLAQSKARGRKKNLAPGIDAFIGKSAKDNLALLRKAKPWDLWFHLRDYPGAHAVICCPRNASVTSQHFNEVGSWLLGQFKRVVATGEKFDVVVCECRHVRPIKGDRLGRVNYSNERVFTVRYQ